MVSIVVAAFATDPAERLLAELTRHIWTAASLFYHYSAMRASMYAFIFDIILKKNFVFAATFVPRLLTLKAEVILAFFAKRFRFAFRAFYN